MKTVLSRRASLDFSSCRFVFNFRYSLKSKLNVAVQVLVHILFLAIPDEWAVQYSSFLLSDLHCTLFPIFSLSSTICVLYCHYPAPWMFLQTAHKYSFLPNTFHLNDRDGACGVTIYFSYLTFWIKRSVLVNLLVFAEFTRELARHSRTRFILNKGK